MGKRSVEGVCQLCLEREQLSFEHVPPRACFNSLPVTGLEFDDILRGAPLDEVRRGRTQQRGMGAFALCGSCNNFLNSSYVASYREFNYEAARYVFERGVEGGVAIPFPVRPLFVLKQIVSMFLALSLPSTARKNPDLRRFVLAPRRTGLHPRYRIFAYLTRSALFAAIPLMHKANVATGRMSHYAVISFPPLGFVLAFDSGPPQYDLAELTGFARFSPADRHQIFLNLPVYGPSVLPGPFVDIGGAPPERREAADQPINVDHVVRIREQHEQIMSLHRRLI